MTNKITLNQILEQAKTLTANSFDKFLNENRIDYDILDSDNIMDYNEGYLNIMFSGDDCEESFLFIDGVLDSSTYIA